MTQPKKIANNINSHIKTWTKDQTRLVIAIDGYAGSGKTTVADLVAEQNPDVLVVHLDDFIKHWQERKLLIKSALDKPSVFERNWYRYEDLKKLLKAFRDGKKETIMLKTYDFDKNDFAVARPFDLTKKVLITEGIFLFHPIHDLNKEWDKTIYLDMDLTQADKRRIAREKKKWGENYLPENHPDNWIQYYKKAYRDYLKKHEPQKKCDLVFDIKT